MIERLDKQASEVGVMPMQSIQPTDRSRETGPSRRFTRAEFGRQVHDALDHLYDPVYLQTHPLTRLLNAAPSSRSPNLGRALRQILLDAIEGLRPASGAPTPLRSPKSHQILKLRFVDGLEVPAIQDQLAIGRSTYYSEQQRAVEAVTSVLWEGWHQDAPLDLPQPSQLPRLVPPIRPPHNLPLQVTSFVGRERELAEVRRLLGTTRLLTLTGTGGSGKTRLSCQVAEDLLGEYPDGVWVVELATISDPELVAEAAALTLGVRETAGRPILQALLDHLKSRHLLLVLDNCEHLLDACARLADSLLRACPKVKLLTTSREALAIAGETSYRVPSLSLPDLHHLPPLGSLIEYEAVRLFVERARAVRPSFTLTEQNAPFVAQVCWRLDGIPLALELAAARVRGLSVEQIAARLDDRFRLLTSGSRTATRRQQTLRGSLDWSHELLAKLEQTLFRRLAVFSGGFTLEAVEEVCSGAGSEATIDPGDVLDLLLRLVDCSLVVAEESSGEVRYHLLETIRQYAGERLQGSTEHDLVRRRHLDWCLGLTRRAESRLLGPDSWAWLDRLEVEHDNLRAALGFALERDVETGLEIVGCLLWFWDYRCHFREGSRWAAQLLERSSAETLPRARALRTAGMMARGEGAWAKGAEFLEESVRLCRQLGDKLELGKSLCLLANTARVRGEADRSERLSLEAVEVSREVGNGFVVSDALLDLADLAEHRGDRQRAMLLHEESLRVAREIGHQHGVAYRLVNLGRLELPGGDLARARALIQEGLAIFRIEKHGYGISVAVLRLGFLALFEGELAEAKALLSESLRNYQQIGAGHLTDCLELAAELEVRSGAHWRGACLFGAIGACRQRSSTVFQPLFQDRYEAAQAEAREVLGKESFARAWAEGQAMTLEQAVEYALTGEA